MTAEELKITMSNILHDVISQQIYFILRQDDTFILRLADIEDDSATPELKNMFLEYIHNNIIDNNDLQLCKLSADDERENAIYHYDYDMYPETLGLINDFDIGEATVSVEKFDFARDDLSDLFGYIIYLGNMKSGITIFKKHYPISLIKRDSFLLGAIKSKQRFEKVSGEDIIRMNGTIQLFRVADQIYIIDVKMLERSMGFCQLLQQEAQQTVDAVKELGIIEDIEVLKDSIEEVSFARKLSKVKRTSPIFSLGISKEMIIEFTKNTAELLGKFKYSEDGNTIRLDTKKSKDAFIKLMNDSFLRSELTKQYYEASAKDKLVAN